MRLANRWLIGLAPVLMLSATALADPYPSRYGESGMLDVPDAESLPLARAMLGGELRLTYTPGTAIEVGPSPVVVGTGLGGGVEIGVSGREGGEPGDPNPSPFVVAAAVKVHVLDVKGYWPALAFDVVGDNLNTRQALAFRAIASTRRMGPVRLAAFLGAELDMPKPFTAGPTEGLAVSVLHPVGVEGLAEVTDGPRGLNVGTALRWRVGAMLGLFAGVNWFPQGKTVVTGIGFSFTTPSLGPAPIEEAPKQAEVKKEEKPTGPVFTDETPHMRLKAPDPADPDSSARIQYEADPEDSSSPDSQPINNSATSPQ